jgi:phospholipid transport system substrate-binding protein
MKTRIVAKVLFLLLFCLTLFSVVPPQTQAGEGTNQVKETVDEVIKILNIKELKSPEKEKERREKIRAVIEKRFDFAEMAKRALSIHWKQRTPEEQKEFVSLFSDLLEDTYIRKIEKYENENVQYIGEKMEGNYATVRTQIVNPQGGTETPVDYRIFKQGDKWEVYDIIVEGVSLVNNYRTQFNQIIRSSSYEELVKRLKKKTIKGT